MVTAKKKSRITVPFIKVISMFLENSDKQFTGSDVFRATNLQSGTVYPLLAEMVEKGWLNAEWENVKANDIKSPPPRRLYRITNCGFQDAIKLLSEQVSPAFARSFNQPPVTV